MAINAGARPSNATRKTALSKDPASGSSGSEQATRQRDTAQYVADMILELRNLAKSAQLFQVMVPLEYAYYEAFAVANRVEVPQAEVDRLRELSKVSENIETLPEDY